MRYVVPFSLMAILLQVVVICTYAQRQVPAFRDEKNDLLLLTSAEKHQYWDDPVKLSVNITPTGWVDPWDGTCTRMAIEYFFSKNRSLSLDGGIYLRDQPDFSLKKNARGFEIRPMVKIIDGSLRRIRKRPFGKCAAGEYLGIELLFKHQVFDRDDSISIGSGTIYDKWYTIDRYVGGVTCMWGQYVVLKCGVILSYYVGGGVRFKHSTSNLPDAEEKGILTGEGHGDLIGGAERSVGNFVSPSITLGVKIGYRVIKGRR
jgi:hypothetical protein